MNYNFKQITAIPSSTNLIDIVLSKTQRKTPTVVHQGYAIGRIRAFYMRKVKFTQDSIHEKLTGIIDNFPKLDDIHPFFADLINVLYDRDHYKLALGHVHSCKNLIDNIAKDYVRLLKYADSLYRAKQLKKAALGRMCTIIKKLTSSLNYLEEVRKHLARLPSINPFERTLLITGYPNVGKSSFTNNITNAQVDVQPYPFTTQSLYVGHTDYEYVRWQVIDSPGILDHSLEERNTIEMQSITALAHLKACILYFIDISEMCGYTIDQQIKLFNNIKPLFKNKPHLLVLTKTDLKPVENVPADDMEALKNLAKEEGVELVSMSNKDGAGITDVKTAACNLLSKYRDAQGIEAVTGGHQTLKEQEKILRGMYIAQPKKRDNIERQIYIPEQIKQNGKREKINRPTLRQIQDQNGGAGAFHYPLEEHFQLEDQDWKYDMIPEIMDGKNIADFVDKDILIKLEALEREEEMLEKARELELNNEDDEELSVDDETQYAYKEVVSKRAQLKLEHKLKRNKAKNVHRPTMEDLKKVLPKGADVEKIEKDRTSKRKGRKMESVMKDLGMEMEDEREDDNDIVDENEEGDKQAIKKHKLKKRSLSRSRTQGFKQEKTPTEKAMDRVKFKIDKLWQGRAGEADRAIGTKMPKHMFSGKRGHAADRR